MKKNGLPIARTVFTVSSGILFLCAFTADAHAYIDPGSGSHLFQVLIAGLVAALYAVKVYWTRFTSFLKKIFRRPPR